MRDLIPRAAVLEILRTPAASDTFPDMIARVEALEGGGVRVKALVWRQVDAMRLAYPYCFDDRGASWSHDRYPAWSMDPSRTFSGEFSSPGEAKAACEADHQARILAAMEATNE